MAGALTLAGTRVMLMQLDETVVDPYFEMLSDPEGKRLTGTHAEFTIKQTIKWLASRPMAEGRYDWAIFAGEDFVGEVVLNEIDRDNLCAGLRIGLRGPAYFGRGYGTEAVRLVVGHAFEALDLHRVELEVYAFNRRAFRVYEKCGFVVEGRRRDALRWDGEWVDAICMAVLSGA